MSGISYSIIDEFLSEVTKQDNRYGVFGGHMATGRLRLAIAVLEDETIETRDAWREDRRTGDWSHTRAEALQVAAVAMRLVRQIDLETAQQCIDIRNDRDA